MRKLAAPYDRSMDTRLPALTRERSIELGALAYARLLMTQAIPHFERNGKDIPTLYRELWPNSLHQTVIEKSWDAFRTKGAVAGGDRTTWGSAFSPTELYRDFVAFSNRFM